MSIFEQEPKVSRNSWHYKMLNLIYWDKDKPKSQCSYFWTVLFLVILSPLWVLGALMENRCHSRVGFWKSVALSIIAYAIICIVFMLFIGLIVPLGMYLFPEIVAPLVLENLDGSIFNDDDATGLGSFIAAWIAIDVLLVLGSIVIGIWEFLKWFGRKLNNAVEKFVNITSEHLNKKDALKKERSNNLTFVGSFVNMLKDRKDKICRSVRYVDENNS